MDNFTGGVADVWGNEGPDMGNGLDINPGIHRIHERTERCFGSCIVRIARW